VGVVITPRANNKRLEVKDPDIHFGEGDIEEYSQTVVTKKGNGVFMYGDVLTNYPCI
jgi:hypothetical protein